MTETTPWRDDLTSFVTDSVGIGAPAVPYGGDVERNWKFHAVEFWRGFAEMSVEFGKGVRDVVKQSVMRDDSFLVKRFGPPINKIRKDLKFLNEYLPEDRDPVHSWTVIFFVLFFVVAALYVNTECDETSPLTKKLYIQPPNATRILLPDGRHLAYQEQGVPAARSRYSIIAPHSFLSSRLAGIPGIKISLLEEFGVRLITYDLPGFGESDPHPNRNLKSSADDVLHLSYAVGVTDKFWVIGYSGGSLHAWATLRYIPDRVAGAFMVSPMINPYEPSMSKEERRRTWSRWTLQKKFMYFLARRFPRLLPYFYRRGFLSGSVGQIYKWLSLSLGKRDRDLIEDERFEEFWLRDVAESVRQGNVKPFVEEAVLQVSSWGFRLSELKVQKKQNGRGVFFWIKSKYSQAEEELTGFLGPIHIWQPSRDFEEKMHEMMLLSPNQFGVESNKVPSSNARTLGSQYTRRLEVASSQVAISESFKNLLNSNFGPSLAGRKESGSHPVVTTSIHRDSSSATLEITVASFGKFDGAENFCIMGGTPFRRSLDSPSAWKSPWFMNSFVPGPKIGTNIIIDLKCAIEA